MAKICVFQISDKDMDLRNSTENEWEGGSRWRLDETRTTKFS